MQETERQLSNANSHLQQLQTYQEVESGQLEYIRNHLSREGKRMATDFPEFAHALLPAIEDSTIFTRLQKTAEDYATKAQQISQLQLAEREAHGVQVLVNKLEADLVSLREFTRGITIDDAQDRFDTFSSASKQLETDLSREQVELGQLKEQHEERQRLKPLLQKVKQQCWAYGEIEKALARGGKRKPAGALITQISNTLMQGIAQEATKILEELKWHIAVQYHATNGFEVEDQSAAVRRRYQEFSGGERFAISIAVALAASAATNKTSSIRCLFIDEGFGALDERHRKRIVNDAIGRLISRGLRDQVVVITHIQDMQEYFPNRIELRREDGQSVLVTGDQTLP